ARQACTPSRQGTAAAASTHSPGRHGVRVKGARPSASRNLYALIDGNVTRVSLQGRHSGDHQCSRRRPRSEMVGPLGPERRKGLAGPAPIAIRGIVQMHTQEAVDVIVIGAGPAGENVAGICAQSGLEVAVVEGQLVGGECSYWGCIPSK